MVVQRCSKIDGLRDKVKSNFPNNSVITKKKGKKIKREREEKKRPFEKSYCRPDAGTRRRRQLPGQPVRGVIYEVKVRQCLPGTRMVVLHVTGDGEGSLAVIQGDGGFLFSVRM